MPTSTLIGYVAAVVGLGLVTYAFVPAKPECTPAPVELRPPRAGLSTAQLIDEIVEALPDKSCGGITPATLRTVLVEIAIRGER